MNLSAPKLRASMWESPFFTSMGVGLTDTIFLLGHADGLTLNEPYKVASMQKAVDILGADTDSPLLIALLEAYYTGARDIWLVASAPMSEYQPDLELRDQAYYETYRNRLNDTYEMLKYWDIAQITVPIEAPFNSTVDFLIPLVNYCVDALVLSGDIHLGIIGTRGLLDANQINAMRNDARLTALGSAGKFVSVFVGDVTFHLGELPFNHTSSAATVVAAEVAQLPMDRGIVYTPLRNVISTVGPDLTKEQINELAESKLNPVGRNRRGRRGNSFQVVAFTDNTLGEDGSDYWSLTQMRLVSGLSAHIRALGKRSLGTIGYDLFYSDVEEYLISLVANNFIREYTLDIQRDPQDRHKVLVDVSVAPFFGLRDLYVSVSVGPSQG